MEKIKFDIKYREQIESGEIKVITSHGEPAKIVKWNCHGLYPLLVVMYDGNTDDAAFYTSEGFGYGSWDVGGTENYLILIKDCDNDEYDYDKI